MGNRYLRSVATTSIDRDATNTPRDFDHTQYKPLATVESSPTLTRTSRKVLRPVKRTAKALTDRETPTRRQDLHSDVPFPIRAEPGELVRFHA